MTHDEPHERDAEGVTDDADQGAPVPDWDAVRADYERGVLAVSEIASRHKVDTEALLAQRRTQAWRRRVAAASAKRGRELAGRVMALIEGQISLLEDKLDEGQEMSASDLRLLEAATKTLEKLIQDQKAKTSKDVPKPMHLSRELEAVRQRLIERVRELGQE